MVRHSGTIVDWSVNAGSVGGQVQLRVLRPAGHGSFRVIRSSAVETVSSAAINAFAAHLKVKRGDVLALSNDSSGSYMASAPAGNCVRYFGSPIADGSAGQPDQISPQLHPEMSADVHS